MSGILIENAINKKLTGETQNNALDFVAFMRENGFSFEGFDTGKEVGWTPTYKGEGIGCIMVAPEWSQDGKNMKALVMPLWHFLILTLKHLKT